MLSKNLCEEASKRSAIEMYLQKELIWDMLISEKAKHEDYIS